MDRNSPTTSPVVTISAWDRDVTRAYEANRSGLIAAASRIVGPDHAADVAQDAFIRIWSNPDAFDASRGTLTRYLYLVVRGVSIDCIRALSSQRRRDVNDTGRSATSTNDETISRLVMHERQERVRLATRKLRDGEREAIIAAYFGHLTYREVADKLGLPEGTIKSRIRLGLLRLRAELGGLDSLAA